MSNIDAWRWIVSNWNVPSWKGIPVQYANAIGLDNRVGMCHGALVTQYGAKGMNEFLNRMNDKVRGVYYGG